MAAADDLADLADETFFRWDADSSQLPMTTQWEVGPPLDNQQYADEILISQPFSSYSGTQEESTHTHSNDVDNQFPVLFHCGIVPETSPILTPKGPPKDRDRHRQVEQKYRDKIKLKMDELYRLLGFADERKIHKWVALDNAIKLITSLRKQNDFLRTDNANLRAQVFTLQCALNRSMGVDFVPTVPLSADRQWSTNSVSSPDPSLSIGGDDVPVQRTRINVQGSTSSVCSPLSPLTSSVSSPYSADGSNSNNGGASHASPRVIVNKGIQRSAVAPSTAAIPERRTVLACVLFSMLFFWNPFITQNVMGEQRHYNHDHAVERVFDSGSDSSPSLSFMGWFSSTYIMAGLVHLLIFAWLLARLFILPEQLLSAGPDNDVDADVKHRLRQAQECISAGRYSVAFNELSLACAALGHPLPQSYLDVVFSLIWAVFRQIGHILRFGLSVTIWMVSFLTDGPVRPDLLHRRLIACANVQQQIIKLATTEKIDLPVCTKMTLALSSISLQETAAALSLFSNGTVSNRYWHTLLEDSYITAGIAILELPLPGCFFSRYYFFQASTTSKLSGSVDKDKRFGWLYSLDSSTRKDLVSLSLRREPVASKSRQALFGQTGKRNLFYDEPWSRIGWIRSRELLTELLSCLTLSTPASFPTSKSKAQMTKSIDAISGDCLYQLEEIENCLRGGASYCSDFGLWLKLLRACQAWRCADQSTLHAIVQSTSKNNQHSHSLCNALHFSLAAASQLPNSDTQYEVIKRFLRAASCILKHSLHEDQDDIILQFCRLMTAEIILSCRLHLVSRHNVAACDKGDDLMQAEVSLTAYLTLLERICPNHPRTLMYRARIALSSNGSPIAAERFATLALSLAIEFNQGRARFSPKIHNDAGVAFLSAEAVLLLALIRLKIRNGKDRSAVEREALLQAIQSFKQENSPALARLCSQMISIE